MKISRLLELHLQNSAAGALPDNLGDSYLLNKNKIYGQIRKRALEAGYSFSSEYNPDYLALPLSQLEIILSSKKIPYCDNVGVLKEIGFADWTDIAAHLRKNFIFHESCHAAARAFPRYRKTPLSLLMEEAFANTCEFLAVVDANDAAHRIFLEMNSYTALFEEKTFIKNAAEELGFSFVSEMLFYGYLHSNHLHSQLDEKSFKRMLKLAQGPSLTDKQTKQLKHIMKICFTLDEDFKQVTTGFYMKIQETERSGAASDYLSELEKNNDFSRYLIALLS